MYDNLNSLAEVLYETVRAKRALAGKDPGAVIMSMFGLGASGSTVDESGLAETRAILDEVVQLWQELGFPLDELETAYLVWAWNALVDDNCEQTIWLSLEGHATSGEFRDFWHEIHERHGERHHQDES